MPPDGPGFEKTKRNAAIWSLAYNAVLTVLKLVAALLTGSVALLSEAAHSATDIVASSFALIGIRIANEPPDDEHPYGHGKAESLAGFAESVLLLLIVGLIITESIQKLRSGSEVQNLGVGIWIMLFSAVTSPIIGTYVRRVGEKTESLALRSNGQHLMIDFWTSIGVLAALVVTGLTGWQAADAIFAIVLAIWIAFGAIGILREAIDQLIDRAMPQAEVDQIIRILSEEPGCLSFHRLRTRHSGNLHYIDVHIVVPNDWSVVQAHDLADSLEKHISSALPPAHVVIHVDPFDPKKVCQE